MQIASHVFEAYLKCPTKSFLRSHGETGSGNAYAHWVRAQSESYRSGGITRLTERIPACECVLNPRAVQNPKTTKWQLAVDLEARLHAVQRVPSEGRGRPAQFIPIRFAFTNKLSRDDRLLLGFDAFVLSEVLGSKVSLGKIIHGDDHAALKVKVAPLLREAWRLTGKMAALLSSGSPPDLVLNRHCAECEFRDCCRQKAIEKDDLSLLAGMTEKERDKY